MPLTIISSSCTFTSVQIIWYLPFPFSLWASSVYPPLIFSFKTLKCDLPFNVAILYEEYEAYNIGIIALSNLFNPIEWVRFRASGHGHGFHASFQSVYDEDRRTVCDKTGKMMAYFIPSSHNWLFSS
uniref:Uncharacterized protein n=1 Tax=Cacopsylla melanoneura TaxID=428564 RepID=A0A8D8LGK7_9HEMI